MKMKLSIMAAAAAILLAFSAGAQTQLKKVYDTSINPMEQIDKALVKAKADGKFVLCQVGGNWCIWCLRFADFVSKDADLTKIIDDNFVYIHVNYEPRNKDPKVKEVAQKMLKRLGGCDRFGYPVFVVLDQNGKVVHIQDSSYLEDGGSGYDKKKVFSFFNHWTPSAVNR